MNTLIRTLALAGLFVLPAASASAGVSVTFSNPENFVDLPYSAWEREQVLKDVTEHFTTLAKELPAGQDLRVEVLDFDMAGRLHPNRRGGELRVLKGGADWPRIRLRYTLELNGQVISSGEDMLSNMAYLNRSNRYASGDMLRYEKQMIDDWFKKKIVPKQAS